MSDYVKGWKRFVLSEGILEKEATAISREIVEKFKKLVKSGEVHKSKIPYHWLEAKIPDTLASVADVNSIQAKVTVRQGSDSSEPVTINAAFGTVQRIPKSLFISMVIHRDLVPTSEALLKVTSQWLPALKNLIRHELEHARQTVKKAAGTPGTEAYKGEHFGKAHATTRREVMEYLTSQEEKEAYVAGIYKKAKTEKKPFVRLLDSWLGSMHRRVLKRKPSADDLTDEEVQSMITTMREKYLAYARERFPEAQL